MPTILATPSSIGVTLSTETPANVPFYQHLGYEVVAWNVEVEDWRDGEMLIQSLIAEHGWRAASLASDPTEEREALTLWAEANLHRAELLLELLPEGRVLLDLAHQVVAAGCEREGRHDEHDESQRREGPGCPDRDRDGDRAPVRVHLGRPVVRLAVGTLALGGLTRRKLSVGQLAVLRRVPPVGDLLPVGLAVRGLAVGQLLAVGLRRERVAGLLLRPALLPLLSGLAGLGPRPEGERTQEQAVAFLADALRRAGLREVRAVPVPAPPPTCARSGPTTATGSSTSTPASRPRSAAFCSLATALHPKTAAGRFAPAAINEST